MTRDFQFVKRPNIATDLAINLDHLDDLGTIYYHTHQAWQLTDQLKQPLDFQLPLDIIAFSAQFRWEPRGVATDNYVCDASVEQR